MKYETEHKKLWYFDFRRTSKEIEKSTMYRNSHQWWNSLAKITTKDSRAQVLYEYHMTHCTEGELKALQSQDMFDIVLVSVQIIALAI